MSLPEWFDALDLVLLNSGARSAFSSRSSSITDFTFDIAGLATGTSWEVNDTYALHLAEAI